MRNLQTSASNYTVAGLRRVISGLYTKFGVDEGSRVSAIIVEQWLNATTPLYKAKWDTYIDEHQDWHIHVKLKTRHVGAYRGAVTVRKSDKLVGENYREMFKTIAENHNARTMNLEKHDEVKVESRLNDKPEKIVRLTEIRGTTFAEARVREGGTYVSDLEAYESVKTMSNAQLSEALTPEQVDEQCRDERMNNATVLELLGQGNFKIRGR